jgi:protein ImuB
VIERRISPKQIVSSAVETATAAFSPPACAGGADADGHTGRRIACLLVKDFPLAAAVRQNSDLRDQPLVLVESSGRRDPTGVANLECRFVSARARAMGVRPGMTVAKARAIAPTLIVTARSQAAEAAAAEALIDVASSLSPLVEACADGEVYLDIGGLQRLYGNSSTDSRRHGAGAADAADYHSPDQPDAETALAQEVIRRVARIGMEAAAGVASGKEVSLLAARCGGARVISAGREEEFLSWLPLDLLELGADEREGEELEQTLARWGIRRLGDLARLDVRAIGSRLGARAVALVRIARGESRAPFLARRAAESFAEGTELEWGADNLEALGFVMRPMLERIVERLKMRGMAAGDITLTLELDDHRRDTRHVALPAPTNETRTLLTLAMLRLETSPPPAAVIALRIVATSRSPRAAQADMFAPPHPAPERLHVTLARLAALCGPDRVGTLVPRNSHLPGAVELAPFDPPPAATAAAARQNAAATPNGRSTIVQLAIRSIRPPRKVEVLCTRRSLEFVRGENFGGRVISCAGPWRIAGAPDHDGTRDRESGAARDYYDVALEDGTVYRLFHDLRSGDWYTDGIYD